LPRQFLAGGCGSGPHKFLLVVAELEDAFVGQGPEAIGAAARIAFPSVRDFDEKNFACEAMHQSQLHDMEVVIEAARDHRQPCTGLLVERPESEIVAAEIVQEGADSA